MPFPNPDTQFKPGSSGNPKGRPRRRAITDLLLERLDEATAGGIVDSWLASIKAGDVAALRELLNRIEGKVPDRLQVAEDSRPPRINPRPPEPVAEAV